MKQDDYYRIRSVSDMDRPKALRIGDFFFRNRKGSFEAYDNEELFLEVYFDEKTKKYSIDVALDMVRSVHRLVEQVEIIDAFVSKYGGLVSGARLELQTICKAEPSYFLEYDAGTCSDFFKCRFTVSIRSSFFEKIRIFSNDNLFIVHEETINKLRKKRIFQSYEQKIVFDNEDTFN